MDKETRARTTPWQNLNCVLIMTLSGLLAACTAAPSRSPMSSPAVGLMGELVGAHTYYPDKLLLEHIPGRALVGYSIDGDGLAQRVGVIKADDPAFGLAAMQFVRDWHFDVPSDWSKEGGSERRFRLRLIFVIQGKPAPRPWYSDVVTIPVEGKVR